MSATIQKTVMKANNILVCSYRGQRNPKKKGFTLWIKSPMIEEFMSKYGKSEEPSQWGNVTECYHLPISDNEKPFYYELYSWSLSKLRARNGEIQMAFLRAVGLKDGIEITFDADVYTTDEIKVFMTDLKQKLNQFYSDFLMPIDSGVEITVKEVDKID